jgi:RHS repeat-associated protein
MRPWSFTRAGRRAALTVGTISALSLFSFAPWNTDQHPAQAQDVLAQPSADSNAANPGTAAPVNPAFLNMYADKAQPFASAPVRPVQGPLPPEAPMLTVPGMEEPLVATGASVPEQEAELKQLIAQFTTANETAADFAASAKPFEDYAAKYPSGPWTMSVLATLGFGYYRDGYFSRALAAWEQAWPLGKDSTVIEVKRLADKVMGERIKLMSRVGRPDAIQALLDEIKERPLTGAATEAVSNGHEALTVMRHQWGAAYLCGPRALMNVLHALKGTDDQVKVADDARSGPNGFSLTELSALATKAGVKHKLIKREPGQPVPVPSVVNWKLHHYAAIVGEENGKFRIEDPTFADGVRTMTREALDDEGSGYYLVPLEAKASTAASTGTAEAAPGDWRELDAASDEAKAVYGRGQPASSNPLGTHQCSSDSSSPPGTSTPSLTDMSSAIGMCAAKAQLVPVSVTINDTPVGYAATKGHSVRITLTYNQREQSQPANFTYFNFGQKWNMNWQSSMYENVQLYRHWGGGGGEMQMECSTSTGICRNELFGAAIVKRVPATGTLTHYEVKYPDGAKDIYGLANAPNGTRRIFLTQKIDSQGNATTLAYDAQFRLTTITDATGKATSFCYDPSGTTNCTGGTDKKVYRITDPFGRYTSLTYDASQRLATITDTVGITSSFTYDGSGLITQLTTPYGTNGYSFGESGAYLGAPDYKRWLQVTDALGASDWTEYNNANQTGVPEVEPAGEVPTGMYSYNGTWYWQTNTFYFDRHVNTTHGHADYTKALLMRWTTNWRNHAWAEPILRNLKPALERKIWFNYKGQNYTSYSTLHTTGYSQPTVIGRVQPDGTTKLEKADYYVSDAWLNNNVPDGNGALLSKTDALGRKTVFEYDPADRANLTAIKQQISATPTYATLAQFTYDTNRNMLTRTDAAGQVWRYAYNAAGQLIYATNPLNETRFWEYDSSARLTRVTVPFAVAHASVVYGTTNLSAATAKSLNYTAACSGVTAPANTNLPISVTDSEGYVKCYQYDALDRIVKVKYHDGTTDQYDYTFPAGLASQPTWTTGTVPTAGSPSLDVWKITDRLGRITNNVYDRNRRLIKASETVTVSGSPVTRTTQYAYYANGTLKELTDANGNVTRWDIDIQSRPTSKTYAYGTASAKTESYTYDIVGRLKTRTDARGQTLTYTYNKDDTVASYAFTNAVVATPGASFVYDAWYPRRTSMVDQFGTTTWTYKAVGTNGALKPDVEDGPFANDSITLAYDAAGRANSRTISGTAAETFGFDTLGRMNSHVTALGSFSYGYLGNSGQVSSRTIGGITTSWGYDTNTNDRRLLTISTTGAVARNFSYTSNAYQITGITDTAPGTHPWLSQTWSFTHDASDRLLTGNGSIAGNHSYGLDKLDNATSFAGVAGTYNGLNQIATFNAQTYTYDANGNLSADGTRTYTFDAADRLKTITQGATTVTFAYDGLGRRLKQTVGATETRYLWCGAAICQQRSGSDTAEKRFYAEGEYVHTGTKKYLTLADHLGSVRDVIDITGTPTLVGSFDYRPYGAVARSWGTVTTGYTYAGLFAQTNTSLLLSTTRAYNPANGRWLNIDPKREKGGVNLYGYTNGSPILLFDPLGMEGTPSAPLNGLQLPTTPGFGQSTGNLQCFPGSQDSACRSGFPEVSMPVSPQVCTGPPSSATPPPAADEFPHLHLPECAPMLGGCAGIQDIMCGTAAGVAGGACSPGLITAAACGLVTLGVCKAGTDWAVQRCKLRCGEK